MRFVLTADIINLRQVRKRKTRRDHDRDAVVNRARYGRSKLEKQQAAMVEHERMRLLDGARLDDASVAETDNNTGNATERSKRL